MQTEFTRHALYLQISSVQSNYKEIFNMTTLSSKPAKTYRTIDFISVFVFLALILTLVIMPFTGNFSALLSNVKGTQANVPSYSFSADQQYWGANCSHGWSSNSTCDDIVTRTQSCSISTESAYCSEYESYLKQFAH